jgi:ABC-type amino acid transport substrate-binding protein
MNSNSKQYSIVENPIIDTVYFGAGYGIAVNKNATDLLNAINQALAEIKANGTYKKISNHYFGK